LHIFVSEKMTRFDRITAILVQLQSKKIVTAQEIADRFEISLRTVYRDIRSLEEAGVPIVSEAGVGYSMMEGYRLPPIVFSKEEALSFITAEKLMDRFSDYSINKDYQSALFKVKAVLRSSEKESIARVDGSISVLPNSFIPDVNSTPLGKIMAGIESGTALSIKYLANYTLELSTRIVEPIGVFHQGQHWHMIAYCRLRKDYRDFRLDRIQHIENREDRIEGKHPALQTFLNQVCKNQQLTEVIIEVQRDKYRHIGDQKYYNGFISQEVLKDVVKITFLAESLEGFARWYLMIGDVSKIIKPTALVRRVKELSTGILNRVKQ